MQWIEIEMQERNAGQCRKSRRRCNAEDQAAPLSQEAVDRRERLKADFFRFAARMHKHEQRRQHRDREHERDDHADARDQAEFADA